MSMVTFKALAPTSIFATRSGTWVVAAACALAVLPSRLFDANRFDEGFIVTGAMPLRDGSVPLRDFYSIYKPAQYALLALLYALFGDDSPVSRLADTAILGATGALFFVRARQLVDVRAGWLAALAFAGLTIVAHSRRGRYQPAVHQRRHAVLPGRAVRPLVS
jgi:hypothetical protein